MTRNGDHMLNVLQVEGDKVTKLDREITTGVRPYGLSVGPDGRWAVVANIGRGTGDADTVSLVDLTRSPSASSTPSASARRRRASPPARTAGTSRSR